MALKHIRFIAIIGLLIALASLWIPTGQVQALAHDLPGDLPTLSAFASQIENGKTEELVGIYIPNLLAAPVVTQPEGNAEFVTPWPNFVTQFGAASRVGSTGLLAHNQLAGQSFFLLAKNQTFHLVYGDGTISPFIVTEVLRFQAMDPINPSSTFKDLENGESLSASELFLKIYNRPGRVVFQTCISSEENVSWGRLFIIAEPLPK